MNIFVPFIDTLNAVSLVAHNIVIEVFVCSCVSKHSKLNGRKVTRKYIRIAEKVKI